MSAKIIVILKDENPRTVSHRLAVEMRGREAADAASNDDEVIGLASILGLTSSIPEGAIAKTVSNVERPGMAAAQTSQRGRIVGGGLPRKWRAETEQRLRHHRRAGNNGHAVHEITARDAATHSQFPVP